MVLQKLARILLPLQVGDELQKKRKQNTCSVVRSVVYYNQSKQSKG